MKLKYNYSCYFTLSPCCICGIGNSLLTNDLEFYCVACLIYAEQNDVDFALGLKAINCDNYNNIEMKMVWGTPTKIT